MFTIILNAQVEGKRRERERVKENKNKTKRERERNYGAELSSKTTNK